MKYLTDKQLAERFSTSRNTIWRWSKNNKLPQPVRLTDGCTRWRLVDIENWEREIA